MVKNFKLLINILGDHTVLNAILSNLSEECQEDLVEKITKEYNVDLSDYDYKKDDVYLALTEREKELMRSELPKIYDYDCLKRRQFITDSSYFDIQDEFAAKYDYPFDDNAGYPDIVYKFSNLAWKVFHNSRYA